MSGQVGERLRAERDAVRGAVLAGAGDPEHREVTGALVAVVTEGFLGLLADGRPGATHEALRQVGARYAGARVPLRRVLAEFDDTLIELSRRSWEAADQADVWVLLRLAQDVEREVEPARAALGEGYRAAFAASGTRSTSRRQVAERLLTGGPVDRRLLLAADVAVAEHYLVLCVHDGVARRPTDDVAAALGGRGVLVQRRDGVLVVLVPVPRRSVAAPADAAARAFAGLARAVGAVVAGASTSDVAGLPEAAEEARAVLDVAAACGRRGAVAADEVLVERALTGSPTAVAQLAGVVEALEPWPHLPGTLRALYDHDLDRSATADALHVARRTLTNRLDRIHRLTGVHPTSARGVQTFMTALAAQRLAGDDAGDDVGARRGVG